ncbi:unnamed protein product [Protopolystoma xenopodis]|uniref:PITH domain-containing protein n=1 Tax=Protopolystoma xenopodis TaxID=117903 RepID=A0A448WM47_9PLAT|nr:unnamed protein product [Protopolystoma xenopodis]
MLNLSCLNEAEPRSGAKVFKPYEDRKIRVPFVESDADEELLFNIPFTGNIKLRGVIIAGDDSEQHPKTAVLYRNKPFMAFSDTDGAGDQLLSLNIDRDGSLIYPLKMSKFSNVHHLSIHIKENFGSASTRINYIGLRGQFSDFVRQEVVITTYELAPNIADHKTDLINTNPHFIS